SPADSYSPLPGRALIAAKVSELVVMGGGYPSGRSWNFFGSDPRRAAHVINTWDGRAVFLGNDVGKHVLTGGPLMARGPRGDPVGNAYRWYGYGTARPSWDPLAVWYAVYGLGEVFVMGNKGGWNFVEEDGRNRWVEGEEGRSGRQFFLRLAVGNETAAELVDDAFLKGAWEVVGGGQGGKEAGKGDTETTGISACRACGHEEL
ncbi:hypothetical protein C8A05DRAFT_20269, partial [Staphylotrichum tortipilum]